MKMRFLPELVKCLNEHGYIYSVRKHRYALDGNSIQIDGVGTCQRARIGQINRRTDLVPYVDRSGFETVDDWWKKIKEFNKGYVGPFYLYEITKESEEE